jgi:hypothetical protein
MASLKKSPELITLAAGGVAVAAAMAVTAWTTVTATVPHHGTRPAVTTVAHHPAGTHGSSHGVTTVAHRGVPSVGPGGAVLAHVTPAERARALAALRSVAPGARYGSAARMSPSLPGGLPQVSGNWSGYEVHAARTGTAARSVSGTWVVPSVTSPGAGKPGYSSIWVGVGGDCLDAACHVPDRSLIQLGTAQDVTASGQASYEAWFETLPQDATPLPQLHVAPGDIVTAQAAARGPAEGGGQAWQLSLTVRTPAGSVEQWSNTIDYDSSLSSAEWIVEGPSADCGGHLGELPLADYHTVSFSHLLENGTAPALGLGDDIIGYDPYGQLSIPMPGLAGRTATYFLPFVPKGSAQTQGRATCG